MLNKLNIFKWFKPSKPAPSRDTLSDVFKVKYERFKELLDSNAELSKIITDMEEKLQGHQLFGMAYLRSQSARAVFHTLRMVRSLDALSGQKYPALFTILEEINQKIKDDLGKRKESPMTEWILPYSRITKEMVDWVGGKNANLGEVLNLAHLPIPEGFAITTQAYNYFLAANDLVDEINRIRMELNPNDPDSVNEVSESIQRLIISSPVPHELSKAILYAYDHMMENLQRKTDGDFSTSVSLRSSAIGEDSELSYAGQYLSMLNVSRERLIQTYNFIIASLYTPRAIAYRVSKGIRDEDIAMSVACLQMVESVASGVAYSRHPFNILEDDVLISAVWGLGPYAVDGVITPDSYKVAKNDALSILATDISHKPVQLVSNPDGGLMELPVEPELQDSPCLTPDQIRLLADYVVKLEKHYGCPQDTEWAVDGKGKLLILQTRPLRLESPPIENLCQIDEQLTCYELLLQGGEAAYPGVGSGKVYQVHSEDDLAGFPEGGILVAKHSSPKFVVVMNKAQAIVADSGSVSGHMASLSREFQVPTLMNLKKATATLTNGMEITVDAYSGRIYAGRVPELLNFQAAREAHMENTPVYEALKKVAESIVPLHLYDPKSPTFAPKHCTSLHDIMRLVHEFSYTEMFQISDLVSSGGGYALKLNARIPLDLYVIDLGGGLEDVGERVRKVEVEQVVSSPFKALLTGMLHEDLKHHIPRPVQLQGFFSVMSEQMLSNPHAADRFGDRSYAIISDKYLNFSSRVGYHYSILDSYCGQTMNKNYITFSFKGGAADDLRRIRRVRSISIILRELDFSVDVMGDRVDARLQKYDLSVIQEKLDILGRLLIFTRQMDMLMNSEGSVNAIATAFLNGDYHFDPTVPSGESAAEN
ncbi:PEP/pyruvate-binding domain-containing protein [Desulforhabdus sp. TSK]|uniref:PEP/pyruvate-binding domain-containing protein n=1 Tax=Desulforhabdus sp. TSK TaxID=2925014 RepID=UPI001FC8DC50|nr:PEP/pyruvate-binding domain-containing protein [Desulforhabdus sp. TSK]GKT08815.1 phosphoenolpyruvate synthase [Desulforhabdus sp. TSK]